MLLPLLLLLLPSFRRACETLSLASASLGQLSLALHKLKPLNGHASFRDREGRLFLYFMPNSSQANARWLLSNRPNSSNASAYVDSFAPSPHLIDTISPDQSWHVSNNGVWSVESVQVHCSAEDQTVHLESSFEPTLSGFFLQTGLTIKNRHVFVRPPLASLDGDGLFLWFFQGSRWMLGER